MLLFSEIEYNNNLLSINNTVVCETRTTCDHIYIKNRLEQSYLYVPKYVSLTL